MKLAEALALRADLVKRLEQLKIRLTRVAKVQKGDQPAEDPAALIEEYEGAATELAQLITRINITNATAMGGDQTLTAALAERDVLGLRQGMYRELAKAAAITQTVNTRSEVRFRSAIPVAATQKTADRLATQLRHLDTSIQEVNWTTNLLD